MSKYITTEKLCHKLWIGLVTTMTKHYQDNGDILIRNSDIKECKLVESGIYLNKSFSNQHEGRKLQEDDVVTVHTGDVGTSAKISGKFISSHGFATINSRLNTELIDPDYYCRYLNSIFFKQQIYQVITGDGRDNLNLNDFAKLKVRVPELPTQKRIAKILSTVDGQIEKTEAIIAKYQAIKQGMLHDLFTRGIDLSTGKLRPTPEQAPELYKSSPLGLIPKSWDIEELARCCISNGKYGINAAAVDYSNDLPTYLRITDISDNGEFISLDKKSVNNPLSSNYILSSGDIVFARTGASVGKTYLYNPDDGKLIYAGFLIKFSPKEDKILPKFLKLTTELPYYKNWVIKTSMRSGQPGINGQEYGYFEIPIPQIEEQALICTKIKLLENLYISESKRLTKLEELKQGLLSKLLKQEKNYGV